MLTALGQRVLLICRETGGIVLVLGRVVQRLAHLRADRREGLRALVAFGEGSLPIVVATAAFTGMILVVQSAHYVRAYGAYSLVGWFTGFSTLREVGPLLVGLMISGRVGASNTSELASMRATEQLDALRVLNLDVYALLIAPRTIAIVVASMALVAIGDAVAILAGALGARALLGLDVALFYQSLIDRLTVHDFLLGITKAGMFGLVVATVSSHFGLSARGTAAGVGRAVNAQVVASAVGLFMMDYLLSSVGQG